MKQLIGIMAALAVILGVTVESFGQSQYSVSTVVSTNQAATTNITPTNNVIATKNRFVALGILVTGGAGATNDVTATFQRGLSSSIWDTTTTHTLTVTAAAGTQKGSVTNIDMGSFGYLRLVALTNGGASAVTSTVYSVVKPLVNDQ